MTEKHHIPLIIVFSLFIFFVGIQNGYLWDRDETFYAEVAREMTLRNDYIVPYFNNNYFFDKPPVVYWFAVLGFKIFGENEFGARFFSAIFGLGCGILVYFIGRKLFNSKVAFYSSLILFTNIYFCIISKTLNTDVFLTFFITLSVLFFLLSKDNPIFILLFYAAAALSVLSKGPVGALLLFFIIFPYLIATRELKEQKFLFHFFGIIIFLIITLPWYIKVLEISGGNFWGDFFIKQNIKRFFSSSLEGHSGPIYYYIPALILGFLPWSAFIFQAIYTTFKQSKDKFLLLFFWVFFPLFFFSISKTKLPNYIMSIYPALSIMTGLYFTETTEKNNRSIFGLFLISLLIFLVGLTIYKTKPEFASPVFLFNFILLAVGSFILFFLKNNQRVFYFTIFYFSVFILFLTNISIPKLNSCRVPQVLSKILTKSVQPNDEVFAVGFLEPSMVFYSKSFIRQINIQELTKIWKTKKRIFCFLTEERFPIIKNEFKNTNVIANKKGISESKGEIGLVLISNK